MAFNILVVDDSKTIRAIIIKILGLISLEIDQIYEAANGNEGLDCLKQNRVDLVLSDLNMPIMNGVEMISRMNQDSSLKEIPVIVISTDGSTKRIEELKKAGIREYIRKPFTPESIGAVIDRVLGVKNE